MKWLSIPTALVGLALFTCGCEPQPGTPPAAPNGPPPTVPTEPAPGDQPTQPGQSPDLPSQPGSGATDS